MKSYLYESYRGYDIWFVDPEDGGIAYYTSSKLGNISINIKSIETLIDIELMLQQKKNNQKER